MAGRPRGQGPPVASTSRQNEYFVPRDGIDREVISADICRYLGNDALVRPGQYENPQTGQVVQGYYITAYRNLTTAMIEDLKADSARWDAERRAQTSRNTPGGSFASRDAIGFPARSTSNSPVVQYRMSETHQSRQHRGPTEGHFSSDPYAHDGPRYPGTGAPGYTGASAYPQPGYGGGNGGYGYPHPQQSPPPDPRFSGGSYQGQPPPMDRYAEQDQSYVHTGSNMSRASYGSGAPPQPVYASAPPTQQGYPATSPFNYQSQSQPPPSSGQSYPSMHAPDSSFSRVSPAGQAPPSGFGQGPFEAPSGRPSVPPSSGPAPSSNSSKRRSERDDDRHTPTDRHHRQPRR